MLAMWLAAPLGPHHEPQKPTPPFELANCKGCVPELQSRGAGPEVRGYKAKQTTCSWARASRPGVHTLLVEVKGFALLPGSRVCLGSTRTHSVGARLISQTLFCQQRDGLHPRKQALLHSSWAKNVLCLSPSKFCKTPASLFCSRL